MDVPRPSSAARRSRVSIPTKPDTSLAEWTSKIKALQRQVDDDEEAETRRLEAEIAASRQARMRRSTNYGSRANSVDLSALAASIKTEDRSVVTDEPLSMLEKQRNQDDALKKLMGEDASTPISPPSSATPSAPFSSASPGPTSHSPVSASPEPSPVPITRSKRPPSRNDNDMPKFVSEDMTTLRNSRSPVPTSPKPPLVHPQTKRSSSPISLAAFMGGRATGPRLTQHRPQQDAQDPTQFEQRREISAPHPVFGRGGVAMPGMTGNGKASVVARAIREAEAKSPPAGFDSVSLQRERRISTPTITTPVGEKSQEREPQRGSEREVSRSYTGWSSASRQRTISSPSGSAPKLSPAEAFTTQPKLDPITRPLSRSPNPIIRPITPRTSMSSLVQQCGSKSPAPRPQSAGLHTPPPPSPTGASKGAGLAGPIQPSPRLFGPQIPSYNKSPAFSKPSTPKDPTPSLTRLKGRGFVKGIVERSASLDVGSPQASPTPESLMSLGKRQGAVLDRWPRANSDSPSPAPKPLQMRKALTMDPNTPSPTTPTYSIPLKRENIDPLLKSKRSLPSLGTTKTDDPIHAMKTGDSVGAPSVVSEGGYIQLGSTKTMITFVQPARTGDHPVSPPQPQPEIDELGMRVRTRTISSGLVQERGESGLPVGKPLTHLTKDRAKKPRKGKEATIAASSSKLAAIRETSPTRDEPTFTPLKSETSLKPSSTYTANRTTSPISGSPHHFPSPRTSQGRSVPSVPAPKPDVPPNPSLDSILTPTPASVPPKTDPVNPLASPDTILSPSITPPQSTAQKSEKKVPSSPARHTRIPSTGNRATVMDVAQAFTEALHNPSPSASPELKGTSPPSPLDASTAEQEEYTPPSVRNMTANWGPRASATNGVHIANGVNGSSSSTITSTTITAPPLEKRKSSYEKYSAFILPPLTEEHTPVPSPAGTLKLGAVVERPEKIVPVHRDEEEVLLVDGASPADAAIVKPVQPVRTEAIHLVHDDGPLPFVNVDALYCASRPTYAFDPDVMTISVEVSVISGSTASVITVDAHIFYDSELLAVVHRAKAKSSGLVTTKVWAWQGRRAESGDREKQKVQDLARRYGTAPISVQQSREPMEVISVLGGKLVTRQGTRAHWSAENTAMHVVRSSHGLIFIEELDLTIRNLCSGFSFSVSILDTFYVWHGRGSTAVEQRAALEYAQGLAPSPEHVVELTEDESQADEMFWMILGEGDYAKADYWRWRADSPFVDPRMWVVDTSKNDMVRSVSVFPSGAEFNQDVYLIDCIWELFVVIGREARGRRKDIRLALAVAEGLATKASSTRPFTPPVHALILPTQIPTDLLLTFRDLDESDLNAGDIPDHMNLIPASDANLSLKSTTWSYTALQDHRMLPLGVTPLDVS